MGRQLFHVKMMEVHEDPIFYKTKIELLAAYGGGEFEQSTLILAGDPLRSMRGQGLPMPKGIGPELGRRLDDLGHRLVDSAQGLGDKEVLSLSAGRFLGDMNKRIGAAVSGESPLKLAVLSAHDVSL